MTVLTAGLCWRSAPVDDVGDLLARLPATGGLAWVRRGDGLVGWGEAGRRDPGTGEGRFERAAADLALLFEGADRAGGPAETRRPPLAFVSFTFDPRSTGSTVVIPHGVVARREGRAWMASAALGAPPPPPVLPQPVPAVRLLGRSGRTRYAGSSLPEIRWLEAVDTLSREVSRGDLEKVVLARDELVRTDEPLDPRLLVARLAERFADCHTFLVDGLLGATPELLVRRSGLSVESVVLAGSAARSQDPVTDARLGDALLASTKDLAEHRPAVESVRSVLAPRCRSLRVDPQPHLIRLHNIQHLATVLRGTLAEPLTALELAGALHPTAAVCGTPTAAAMGRIRSLEGMDRGRYSGPVGWVDARGDGELGIALRCAELTATGARLFAGAGIVAESLPEAELEETRLKLRAMQSALATD